MTETCEHCGNELKEGEEEICGKCYGTFCNELLATKCMICDMELKSDYERENGICNSCFEKDRERCEAIALKHKKEIGC